MSYPFFATFLVRFEQNMKKIEHHKKQTIYIDVWFENDDFHNLILMF
jgi:hypothetical protein